MPRNTGSLKFDGVHTERNARPRDEILEDDFSDDLQQSDNGELKGDEGMTNEAILKVLLEQLFSAYSW